VCIACDCDFGPMHTAGHRLDMLKPSPIGAIAESTVKQWRTSIGLKVAISSDEGNSRQSRMKHDYRNMTPLRPNFIFAPAYRCSRIFHQTAKQRPYLAAGVCRCLMMLGGTACLYAPLPNASTEVFEKWKYTKLALTRTSFDKLK